MSNIPTADSLLVADVGNTRIGLAVWHEQQLGNVHRVAGDAPNQWPAVVESLWEEMRGASKPAVVICSVHPKRARALADAILEITGLEAQFVGRDVPPPLPVEVASARDVGPDRVCAAAAAFNRLESACAVASFGTATTIDYVSEDGHFLGGTIMPGVEMSCDALHEHTAKLPRIQVAKPAGPFGQSTYDSIAAGVVYAQVGALREVVERFASETQSWPVLVLTGGSAELIAEHADFVDRVAPDLCLRGAALAYDQAAEAK